ncbi:restriction endonuclease subunit S [Leptospira bourretii]|uniref:restriction endonuclease subunit S n=1 Tax=Leptospira bourretii TaxID=2484962 RepID=UPI00142E7588|nr:restriction endonuclease subunit S [Leptospira bourretii]
MKTNWEIKKLGEVCNFQNGFAFKSNTYKETGLPILRITNIQNQTLELTDLVYFNSNDYKENFERFKVFKNDLVIAMSGATTGKLGINTTETVFYLNQRVGKFIPKKELAKPFLYYFLTTKVEESLRIAAGAAQPNLSTEQINNFEIPLPPIAEQKRIVAILDEAFSAIAKAKENAERNLKNAKELFESYLQGVFENKGEDWEERTIGEVCSLYQGIAINAKTKHALVIKSELPLLRIKDLRNNTEEQFIDPNNFPKNALVNEEDILYTRTGNSLGLVFRGRRGVLHNNSFKIVPNSSLSRDYFFIWLQNPIFKSKIFDLASKAAQPDITHAIFKIQHIAIPTIKEQHSIVQKFNALSAETKRLEAIYQSKIESLEELKKSILQKAFSGKLTDRCLAV